MKNLQVINGILVIIFGCLLIGLTVFDEGFKMTGYTVIGFLLLIVGVFNLKKITNVKKK